MTKRPSFQFYPGDWRRDAELQSCSVTARGLWHEAMCIMHECEPYGELRVNGKPMSTGQLARLVGMSLSECKRSMDELEAAGVPSRTDDGALYSRRMARDEAIRMGRAAFGPLGAEHGVKGAEHGAKGGRPRNATGVKKPPIQPGPSSSSSSSSSTSEGEDTSSLRSDVVPAQPKIEPQAVLVLEPEREIATITELPAVLDRTEEGAAFKAYNATADEMGWPVAQRLTDPRRRSLKLRLRECGGVDGWCEAMAKARASPFLSGTGPRSKGYENWTPDLDYFLQPSTFTKLMEGKYDERLNPGSNNGFSSAVFTGAASAIARRRRAREAGEGLEGQADFGPGAPIAASGTG